jgi:lipopolysaccharide heptosyltransferase I
MDLSGKRVLIVKPSSLGDVVHTLPVVHALKRCYPFCFIGWVVQKGFLGILQSDPAIDEIIPISIPSTSDPHAARGAFIRAAWATLGTLRVLRRKFKADPYDLVLDLHASFRSGLLGLTNPSGLKIGFRDAKELNTRFQHHLVGDNPDGRHAVDKNAAFAEYLKCVPIPEDYRIVVDPMAQERVTAFLREAGIEEGARIVYANPAARWETKYWTMEAWAELADLLVEQAQAAVIFSGSPDDAEYMRKISDRMKQRPIIAAGKLNLAEAVALIEASDVYVGVDSGPMHIAAFAGTPVVALFGPTDPAKVGPYGEGHVVIRNTHLDCLACRKRSCAKRGCLEGISAQTVFDATMERMGW